MSDLPVSQENQVLLESECFRELAVLAWDQTTIYPKNEFAPGEPAGQCGVTNFGLGIWLDWHGIVSPLDMAYEEGKITDLSGDPIGENHTWLRVIAGDGAAHPKLSIRIDLAADQFPGINYPRVIEWDDYWYPDPRFPDSSRIYSADTTTTLASYDVSRFNGRLGNFMMNICRIAPLDDVRLSPEELFVRWNLARTFDDARAMTERRIHW